MSEPSGFVPARLFDLKASSNAIRLYGYLDCIERQDDEQCSADQQEIAEANGMSVRAVRKAVQELQTLGALEVIRRGQGNTNIYALNWQKPKAGESND